MEASPEILYVPDWGSIFAGLALIFSLFSLWYSAFRRGQLSFACSRWTAIGMAALDKTVSAFAIEVDVINSGTHPIILKDLLLEANTKTEKRIFYDPILLFDLTNYVATMGQQNRIATSQKGQAPLPISIPAGQHFEFGYEILFMPNDKKTAVETPNDAPMTLNLYGLTSRSRKYRHIATQEFASDDVKNLVNGSFSGVLSTVSIARRQQFIQNREDKGAINPVGRFANKLFQRIAKNRAR